MRTSLSNLAMLLYLTKSQDLKYTYEVYFAYTQRQQYTDGSYAADPCWAILKTKYTASALCSKQRTLVDEYPTIVTQAVEIVRVYIMAEPRAPGSSDIRQIRMITLARGA